MEETTVIIVAAGSSRRMGADKLFLDLAGEPVLARSLAVFERCSAVAGIVVVTSADNRDRVAQLEAACPKIVAVVPGGDHRHESVAAGLAAVPDSAGLIAIHDAARPLVAADDVVRVLEAAAEHGAAALAHPIADTLKRASVEDGSSLPKVTSSVDREALYGMETPQAFRREFILEAYDSILQSGDIVTDEVSALQAHGHPVRLVMSSSPNPKITFRSDLALAEALLGMRTDANRA